MQLNEAVKEAIKILSEIHCGNMTPMAEEAWKSSIKILEDGLQESIQEPVAVVNVLEVGGNAGIATRIVEIDDPMRERLRPGTKLYTEPPAAQQRPVAWIDVKPNPFDPSCRGAASVQDHALPPGEHKLYAAPQPNRKPLKDKQIIRWITSGEYNVTTNDWASHISFARAVEAAHSIK